MPTAFRPRSRAARAAVAGLFLAGGVTLAPSGAVAQSSKNTASVYEVQSPWCFKSDRSSPIASAVCKDIRIRSGTSIMGTGEATANSNSQVRVASVSANLTQTGGQGLLYARTEGESEQTSALGVTGTPRPGDQLVFHFLGVESLGGSGGNAYANAYGFWDLLLSSGENAAHARQKVLANGTQGPLDLINARQTSGGFDLFLPFQSGSPFNYTFAVAADARIESQPMGTAVGAAITMRLDGIDAETAQGGFISSAVFDPRTGLGSINVPAESTIPVQSTVPEPGMVVLLGTGLAGLVPLVRRRRMSLQRRD